MARTNKLSPERESWRGMIERCERPGHVGFKYYGARGISVCARWRKSFAAFLADMGPRPPGTSLDRFPNGDGNYEPGNCRWATGREQRLNQRPYDEASRVRAAWETRQRVAKGRVDLVGKRFGRLVVARYAETRSKRAFWLCRCDCGNDQAVSGKSLRLGHTRSCGCLNREVMVARANSRRRTPSGAFR